MCRYLAHPNRHLIFCGDHPLDERKACAVYFDSRSSCRCIWRRCFDHGRKRDRKSEAALELIKRGHRLVTDDVVEIRKVSDETLVGSAPDVTKNFIELRGIGIVDVKSMFGVQSVRETQNIDLVITLEDWSREKEYDRLGLEEEYTEFLGNKVVCHSIPIRPGRNLAIIVESAAVNHRQKQMGYNAAQELYKRVQENLAKKDKR